MTSPIESLLRRLSVLSESLLFRSLALACIISASLLCDTIPVSAHPTTMPGSNETESDTQVADTYVADLVTYVTPPPVRIDPESTLSRGTLVSFRIPNYPRIGEGAMVYKLFPVSVELDIPPYEVSDSDTDSDPGSESPSGDSPQESSADNETLPVPDDSAETTRVPPGPGFEQAKDSPSEVAPQRPPGMPVLVPLPEELWKCIEEYKSINPIIAFSAETIIRDTQCAIYPPKRRKGPNDMAATSHFWMDHHCKPSRPDKIHILTKRLNLTNEEVHYLEDVPMGQVSANDATNVRKILEDYWEAVENEVAQGMFVVGRTIADLCRHIQSYSAQEKLESFNRDYSPEDYRRLARDFRTAFAGFTETNSIAHIEDPEEREAIKRSRIEKIRTGIKDYILPLIHDEEERKDASVRYDAITGRLPSWELTYGDGSIAMGSAVMILAVTAQIEHTRPSSELAMWAPQR